MCTRTELYNFWLVNLNIMVTIYDTSLNVRNAVSSLEGRVSLQDINQKFTKLKPVLMLKQRAVWHILANVMNVV